MNYVLQFLTRTTDVGQRRCLYPASVEMDFLELREALCYLGKREFVVLRPEMGEVKWNDGIGGCYVTLTAEGRMAGEQILEASATNPEPRRIGFDQRS